MTTQVARLTNHVVVAGTVSQGVRMVGDMDVRKDLGRIIDDLLGDDPRRALIAYRRLTVDELPWLEKRVVGIARRDGWNWATIGRLLGRSRQGVRARFGSAPPTVTSLTRIDPDIDRQRRDRTVRILLNRRANPHRDPDEVVAW